MRHGDGVSARGANHRMQLIPYETKHTVMIMRMHHAVPRRVLSFYLYNVATDEFKLVKWECHFS